MQHGETRILLDLPDALGFNDLITDADGRVLVGSMHFSPFSMEGPRPPGELYRIDAEGRAALLYGDVGMCNGIGLSPDGRRLYHSDMRRGSVILHDVAEDGSCRNRRVFARLERGDLYVVTLDNTNDKALGGSIFRTRVEVPGLPAALARV